MIAASKGYRPGDVVRLTRLSQRMSRDALAEASDTTADYIVCVELGLVTMRPEMAERIAEVLCIDVTSLSGCVYA